MAGTEVSPDRVASIERTTWATKHMEAIAEIAQLRAANEALNGTIARMEKESMDLERLLAKADRRVAELEPEAQAQMVDGDFETVEDGAGNTLAVKPLGTDET